MLVGGRFRIERPLGQGGMGAVYVAVQEPLGRRVALKVMRERTDDKALLARFVNEARAVAELSCPHVVALYDYGEHEGAPYIAMELLDGETLRARLQRGPAAIDEVLSWLRDIACGLRMAHENAILHRDLKPENVMLVPDRDRGVVAKLLDFGIAKRVKSTESLTPGGAVFGTPGYVAPEVALDGGSDDPRSDVYAFGVVLYEALVNAPPFTAPTSLALLMAHLHEPVPDPRARRADIDAPLASLVMRALAKDPRQRPADGGALVQELDQLRAGKAKTEPITLTEVAAEVQDASVFGTGMLAQIDRPSIAVQPFIALGKIDGDDDVLVAEGISEDVLTALSCFKQLFVVAQSTMWQKGGRETDALRVGKTLGVRYVVGGCVRRAGDRVRINASLVDITTGAQLWAQRYDRDLSDLFAVQDEVAQAIVACVAGHVEKDQAEGAKRKPPHTMAAYDWLARGRALHHRRTLEDNGRAQEALAKALALDPDYAQAHAWKACVLGQAHALTGEERMRDEARVSAHSALLLDDGDAECHRLAGELAMSDGDLARAAHHQRRGVALNPNDARIVALAGEIAFLDGKLSDAVAAFQTATRLDPLNPQTYLRHIACVRYLERDLDGAARIIAELGDSRVDVVALSAAVAALQLAKAAPNAPVARLIERLVTQVHTMRPGWSSTSWRRPFARAEHRALWREGFDRAGV